MYERDISRRDPGCVVFLLDRSDSMKSTWVNSRETLAQGAKGVTCGGRVRVRLQS